jgi:phage-related protein
MLEVGAAIVMGLVNGVTGALGWAWDAVSNLGSTIVDAAKGVLGIASPSKVFEELGAFTSQGFAIGLESNDSAIQSASARALASPAMTGAEASGLSRGGAVSVSVQISVEGSKDPAATAQAVAESLETRLAMFFEGMSNPSPAEAA